MAIYALLEPDTSAVRYVGKTLLPLEHRVDCHMSGARRAIKPTPAEVWLRALDARGERPRVVLLEDVHTAADEYRWIRVCRTRGDAVLNINPVDRPPKPPRVRKPRRVYVKKGYVTGARSAETKARMAEAQRARRERERASKEVSESPVHEPDQGVL